MEDRNFGRDADFETPESAGAEAVEHSQDAATEAARTEAIAETLLEVTLAGTGEACEVTIESAPEAADPQGKQEKTMAESLIQEINLLKPNLSSPGIYAADTGTVLGRGVFAARCFSPGDVVETVPVVLLDLDFQELPLPVQRLVFNWSRLSGSPEKFAVALGYGSLYNHSDQPNLRYSAYPDTHTLVFTAVCEIKPDQQLTINYNQVNEGAEPRKKSWFETNQVKKINLD